MRIEPAALAITVWYDYHCPYSRRAVAWLDGLGTDRVQPTYRAFPLEQVNRDPTSTAWRIWEQPLDYEHYRGRPQRRALAAFLATEVLAAAETPDVMRRFREAVYAARFDRLVDISEPATLARAAAQAGAGSAGANGDLLRAALADETTLVRARRKLAEDWAAAREPWAIFGVPTLQLPGDAPVYVRLEREPEPGPEAIDLLRRLVELRAAAPFLIEVKRPERAGDDPD
jgi:hypothetical protein